MDIPDLHIDVVNELNRQHMLRIDLQSSPSPDKRLDKMTIPAIQSGLRLVYGEINLWGKVIEHEDGYRAQFGYPKRLWCTPAIEPLAGWIGYVYGVPCEVMSSGDDEEIKTPIITKYACGRRHYHIGFCPKCFVLNIKARRMKSKRD
jgi:hypothetical protein